MHFLTTLMNNKEIKYFIEHEMGEVLREKLSAEEFAAVIQGIIMIMEEASSGKITNVYDAMELLSVFKKPDSKVEELKKAINDKERIITLQKEIMDTNNIIPLRIVR